MFLLVGAGGMIGACARFGLGGWINRSFPQASPFPIGTFIINAAGSFLLGLLANLHIHATIGTGLWLFLGVGFCGAFTTFSTFGTEAMVLLETKRLNLAVLYVIASVIVGICFAAIGFLI
ncbi:fluoride efflux transporter CrcB [Aciduricibacillus chroicocephali]|uniref:Fluoride-specific ion channel FluC n=1 Tax=Aciduricibacillus chroicocephali TaxID=3054939 RepID=A0ABY9KUU1_9BACI|nr:fluoride efflux transporter CrcB [Bacillaceae bacterium 44XB]